MSAQFNNEEFVRVLRVKIGTRSLRSVSDSVSVKSGDVSISTLSRILKGLKPDIETFAILCDWLDTPADQFFSGSVALPVSRHDTLLEVRALLCNDRRLQPETVGAITHLLGVALSNPKPKRTT